MERVPEPELMDDAEQAAAYARADFEEPHGHFMTLLGRKCSALSRVGHALDLGCGAGDIALRFAGLYKGWKVDGVDGSPAMLGWAQRDAAALDLDSRVRFVEALLPDDSLPRGIYDLVFSNSLLHHLADPAVLFQSALHAAAPGAAFFSMDLSRPESPERARELVDLYAANEPPVLRRDFYHSLRAAYRPGEVVDQARRAGLSGLEVETVSDRHWIAWGRLGDAPIEEVPARSGAR